VLLHATEACPFLARDQSSVSFAVTVSRVLMKFFCTRSRDVTDQCQIMFGMLPVEHHVFLGKVRFLLRFKNSDNLICSLFLDNASSEIKLICKKYSANVNNIHALDVLHLERDWTVYLLCLVVCCFYIAAIWRIKVYYIYIYIYI